MTVQERYVIPLRVRLSASRRTRRLPLMKAWFGVFVENVKKVPSHETSARVFCPMWLPDGILPCRQPLESEAAPHSQARARAQNCRP
ncbi:hypothetical protein COMA2_20230 [Candidatus Nitrospira nitrificans]|uniref:Uncharacterized protein n=1 Tax=Candidatus Nitrospira nitrificans TaxID=1742973 RepID=A0A0S4LJR5_9BACT|nr:hypothetical protein COMA2_20230 [Candidatus Nitrospira nitrificans]